MSTARLQIKELGDDTSAWDAFVHRQPAASFFHLSAWRTVFAKGLGHRTHYLYAECDGRLVGILPLVHVKSLLFGDSLSSLAFCAYGGAVAEAADVSAALEDAAVALGHELKVDAVEFRYRSPSGRARPTKDLYETFTKPLSADPEQNMQAIRSKQRNVIRKAMKNGLSSRLDDVGAFYEVYAESVRNLGTPVFPKTLFGALLEAFPEQVEILSVYREQQIVSSALLYYFRDEVCPYYWGGVHAARQLNGNDFLCWEIMCRAGARGCTVFDFGRSKKGTGAYQWKANLGFTPQPLAYEYALVRSKEIPNVNPLNPKFRYFVAAWKHLPLAASKIIGPFLARSLG